MIRITVEMLPKGDKSRAYTLAQGVISNDGSGTLDVGNYIYGFSGQAKRAGHDPGIRTSGEFKGFARRREDVWELLRKCLNQGDQGLVTPSGTEFTEPKAQEGS